MANDDVPGIPVRCPQCSAVNDVCITHPPHDALDCCSCEESFIVDDTLIRQFYASDDGAHWILEQLYRAPVVQYFQNRGVPQVEAEAYHIDVFRKVWETKHPQPGNNPRRYDSNHQSGASFRTWLFQIAHNRLKDRRRAALLFSDIEPNDPEGETLDPTALQRDFEFQRSPVEDVAIAREHQAAVHDCQEKLPPREKLAIIVWLEHDGARGVGNILAGELRTHFPGRGASAATASNLLNEALDLMRECLEGKGVTANWSA